GPRTLDYRAGMEALRVQLEWWRLGLRGPRYRVDRYYLIGSDGQLASIRLSLKAGLDAAELLAANETLRGTPFELDASDAWIPSQIRYFREAFARRNRRAVRSESIAWYLFQIAVGMLFSTALLELIRLSDLFKHLPIDRFATLSPRLYFC